MEGKTTPTKRCLGEAFGEDKPLYTEVEARLEANRCLFCYDAPCTTACPTGIDIPGFIRKITSGNIRGAANTIFEKNLLGVSTARVCPVEELCAGACVYTRQNAPPVQIGRLQRYAAETAIQQEADMGKFLLQAGKPINRKVALIGAGPASLACAGTLALAGVQATIYEKNELPGGLNVTGIAPYKMQPEAALREVEWLQQLGFEIRTGMEVGRDISSESLLKDFDAVFLGAGLGRDKLTGIPGEDASGVWGATVLIAKIKNDPAFHLPVYLKTVTVIGGGNSAIDIARELALLGIPDVTIFYRRTIGEMPGYRHELAAARKAGVKMVEQAVPSRITFKDRLILHTNHRVTHEPRQFESDWIVIAIGNIRDAGRLIPGLKTDAKGCVIIDPDTMRTSVDCVYAGGDCINGGKEVVNAVAAGHQAAIAMLKDWGIPPTGDFRRNDG